MAESRREYLREWKAKNPEKHRKHRREYYARNRKQIQARQRARRKADPALVRHHQLRSDYGISLADYERMLVEQGYCCAVCGKRHGEGPRQGLVVDHDHKSSKIRGLLCCSCNLALGYAKDSPVILDALKAYLIKST